MDMIKEIVCVCTEIKEAFAEVLNNTQSELDEIASALESTEENTKEMLDNLRTIQVSLHAFHSAIGRAQTLFTDEEKNLDQKDPEKIVKQMNNLLAKMLFSCSEAHFAILYPQDGEGEADEEDFIYDASSNLLITLKKKQVLITCLPKVDKINTEIYDIYLDAKAALEPYIQKCMLDMIKDRPTVVDENEIQTHVEAFVVAIGKCKKLYDEVKELEMVGENKIDQNLQHMQRRIADLCARTLPLLNKLCIHWQNQTGTRDGLQKQIAFIKTNLQKLEAGGMEPEFGDCIKAGLGKLEKKMEKMPVVAVVSYLDYLTIPMQIPSFLRLSWLNTDSSAQPAAPAVPGKGPL